VFVRSDTNVEDTRDFTGAGLNLTVFNQVQRSDILASIRAVWASPFSERSYHWRQSLLTNPEHVYPSVILHRTVPSEVSGVLVTTDLETGSGNALTISASEGVAAVVDGGAPETLVLQDNGVLRLLASPRTTTRKVLPEPPEEGVVVQPASGRDPLLNPAAIRELRDLARQVTHQMPSAGNLPWDIEFGLVSGRAYLLQIRPLKAARAPAHHPFLVALDRDARKSASTIDLGDTLP
jgi:phosphoenolpyruvate synthase/pyruvate phosphate dikinase